MALSVVCVCTSCLVLSFFSSCHKTQHNTCNTSQHNATQYNNHHQPRLSCLVLSCLSLSCLVTKHSTTHATHHNITQHNTTTTTNHACLVLSCLVCDTQNQSARRVAQRYFVCSEISRDSQLRAVERGLSRCMVVCSARARARLALSGLVK
jgi:hypothetical protein